MSDQNQDMSAVPGRPAAPGVIVPRTANESLRPEMGTPPPRRSRRARNQFIVFLNFVLSLVVFLTLAGGAAIYFGAREFDDSGPLAATDTILVRPNTSVSDIAMQLERLNMISDARIFRIGVRAFGAGETLKAGEYEVKASASMRDIMELMQSGKSVQYSVTIPEGMTVEQAFERIANTEELSGDLPSELPPEGSLAADTLRFTRGMEREAIVKKLIADQKELVDRIWASRKADLPIKDVNEFVTLASIVEKETGRADERPHVASVFVNRLRKGIRLQSDPTIIYGLFGGKGKPADRPIYRSDIDKPTPYNTYTIIGLPPGPIANPGRAALEAVANPSSTSDLYFVADGTGGHVFSTTLDEHNENVARYRAFHRKAEEEAAKAAGGNTTGGAASGN